LLDLAINTTNFWLMNGDNTSALTTGVRIPIVRLAGPPTITYVPFGFKTRLHADNEWFTKCLSHSYAPHATLGSANWRPDVLFISVPPGLPFDSFSRLVAYTSEFAKVSSKKA